MELESDRGLIVKFYNREVVNEAKSWGWTAKDNENRIVPEMCVTAAGRAIVDDVDFISIQIPTVAYSDSIVDRPVKYCHGEVPADKKLVKGDCKFENHQLDCDVHRFWKKWEAYAAGRGDAIEGTDLKLWAGITRGQAEELAYKKIYSVEQLAAMNDSNIAGQWVALRQRARDYLADASKQVKASELAERDRLIKQQGDELASMKDAMRQQQVQMAELLAAAKEATKGKAQPSTK